MTTSAILATLCFCAAAPSDDLSGTAPARLQRFEFAQVHMAVRFRILLYAADRPTANEAARAAYSRIADLNSRLSDYDPHSELSRLSAGSPSAQPVRVSDDLWRLLCRSRELSAKSEGAFDITVGPLTTLWRTARRARRLPPADELRRAREAVDYKAVCLDARDRTVRLTKPRMRLDLGGIAKGYAADEALRTLAAKGVTRALVAASGDIVAGDPPPGRSGWRVAISPLRPHDDAATDPADVLNLSRAAVATSGDAEQFVVIDGVRYSHIVDPRTGVGLTTPSSVTVVASNGTTADALATAISVLDPKRGLALADGMCGIAALIVQHDGEETRRWVSRRFADVPRDSQ